MKMQKLALQLNIGKFQKHNSSDMRYRLTLRDINMNTGRMEEGSRAGRKGNRWGEMKGNTL